MEQIPLSQPRVGQLGIKVGTLLAVIPVIVVGLLVYALYAHGVFEGSPG